MSSKNKYPNDKERRLELLYNNFEKKPAILIGNGINLLTNNRTWERLLCTISEEHQLDVDISKNKSYPLIFEELIFKAQRPYNEIINIFKTEIAHELNELNPNQYHEDLLKLNCSHYLTTNYDYAFERCIEQDFSVGQKNTLEPKHSLKRQNSFPFRDNEKKTIWHIHGELNHGRNSSCVHESIMIGNEQYGDYLGKINAYIKSSKADFWDFNIDESWTHKFFTHNLHIIGFSLDYTETHLWWILNYRARLQKEFQELREDIPNKIYYHYPTFNKNDKNEIAKRQLLKALNIIPVPTVVQQILNPNTLYRRFYNILLTQTLSDLH